MSHRGNYLDLDPTYRESFGRPMLRMTFDFTDNELKMSQYITAKAAQVAKAMNPREIKINGRSGSWSVVPYQTTHNTGGTVMGRRSNDQRRQQIPSKLGRPEPVRDGQVPFRKTPDTTRQPRWRRSPITPPIRSRVST